MYLFKAGNIVWEWMRTVGTHKASGAKGSESKEKVPLPPPTQFHNL